MTSCSDADAPKDTETNRYYADYIQIYNAYDSLGGAQTIENLDVYLKEFPERKEAYIFKAYILGEMGAYTEANTLFEEAKTMDSSNISIYEYQSAFLLYDTLQIERAHEVIRNGLALNDSSTILYTSLAWVHLYNKNFEAAREAFVLGTTFDSDYLNIYRPGLIAANNLNDDENLSLCKSVLEANGINPDHILQKINEEGIYNFYKNIPPR